MENNVSDYIHLFKINASVYVIRLGHFKIQEKFTFQIRWFLMCLIEILMVLCLHNQTELKYNKGV